MKVEIARDWVDRDWVDYVEAAGFLASLLVAAGALIYAKKSSGAASGSTQAV